MSAALNPTQATAKLILATLPTDPDAAKHRRDLLAAFACTYRGCTTRARYDGYCGAHALDEVAVMRAMNGDPVNLLTHERVEAVRRLAAKRMSDAEIAARLHIADRSVHRIRLTHGIESRWTRDMSHDYGRHVA